MGEALQVAIQEELSMFPIMMTPTEVASVLRVHPDDIRALRLSGSIHTVQVVDKVRIPKASLVSFILEGGAAR